MFIPDRPTEKIAIEPTRVFDRDYFTVTSSAIPNVVYQEKTDANRVLKVKLILTCKFFQFTYAEFWYKKIQFFYRLLFPSFIAVVGLTSQIQHQKDLHNPISLIKAQQNFLLLTV